MSIFLRTDEIKTSLAEVVKYCVENCREKGEIPQELSELIKHNFMAKYVHYNKEDETIEVGINVSKHRSQMYPVIEVYKLPLQNSDKWVAGSFKSGKADLEFYGNIINGSSRLSRERVVIV